VSSPQPPGGPTPPASPAEPPEPAPPTEPTSAAARPSTWQPLLYLKIVLLLCAIAYSIAFVVANSKKIDVHFVFATAKVRLIWEILLLLGIGMVGGILLSQLYRHRRRALVAKKAGEHRHARADVGGGDEAERKPR
jgi:uncharacterized integral membrane protein